MDLQDLIQNVLVANALKLCLKQKPCIKGSKFSETLGVWSLPGLFLCFRYRLVCLIQGLQKNNSAYPGRLATTFSESGFLCQTCRVGVQEDLMMEKEEFSPSACKWSLTILQARHVMNTAGRSAGFHYRWTASCRDFEDLACEMLGLQSW